jgi:hypothetical protein
MQCLSASVSWSWGPHYMSRHLSLCVYVLELAQSVYWLGYRLHGRGFESRKWLGIYLFITASRPALRPTQSPVQWVPGGKVAGASSWPLTPSSAEVKLRGTISPSPQYVFMAWCSEHRGSLPFTRCCWDDEIKKNEICWACRTHGTVMNAFKFGRMTSREDMTWETQVYTGEQYSVGF